MTTGTIFDKTRTPLTTWFDAAGHVTTAKNGLSAKTWEQTMGISCRVAWMMLPRFRVAMLRVVREQLSREVEVDETLIGGIETGDKRGRGTSKEVVAIAVAQSLMCRASVRKGLGEFVCVLFPMHLPRT